MSRRETTARRNTSTTAVRPTERSRAVKKAKREPDFPARIEDATPEQIAKAVFSAAEVRQTSPSSTGRKSRP